ncbi:AAA family ATPase [Spirosoma sp. KUDC1026]|nr:AAA family ATPase [Spirosoma sp. KUDC1026]
MKRWIDESDAYLLLLGGRYGSIDPESGKSYTQLEYEYAIEKGKPFFALVISEKRLDDKIRAEGKSILELDNPQQLKDFRALVTTKLVKFWDDERDIKLAVLQTLYEFDRRPDLIGWVPGNEAANSDIIAKQIARLTEENSKLKSKESFSDSLEKAIQKIEDKRYSPGLTGVPSGFMSLDRVTSGWQPSELIVLAARPAMGKTSFVVSTVLNATLDFGLPVAIFSLEMSTGQLIDRLLSADADINNEKIRKGNLAPHEWAKLGMAKRRLQDAPVHIDDTPSLSIKELIVKSRQLKLQHGIQMIVIDYLQLMTDDNSKGTNREEENASISRALKNLAKELNVPVIALSQLDRTVETRGGDKRPRLADLGDWASLESNADMIMFLYRPEYYNITHDDYGNTTIGVVDVTIAKNRSSALGRVQLQFIWRIGRIADLEGSFTESSQTTPSPAPEGTAGSVYKSRANQLSSFGNANPEEDPF